MLGNPPFTSLLSLNLSFNSLTSLSPLAPDSLPSLLTLDASHNALPNLPLSAFPSLLTLRAHSNRISSLSGLSHVPRLAALWLGNNEVESRELLHLSVLASLTRLLLLPNPCTSYGPTLTATRQLRSTQSTRHGRVTASL